MAKYSYTAKSFKGKVRSGTTEAKSEYDLSHILRKEGYILIKADIKDSASFNNKLKALLSFSFGVSFTDKMMFTRNLQVMISAGVSLPRALTILSAQTQNKQFKKTLIGIKEKIVEGNSFSEALSGYPNVFSELFTNMIKAGEESGTLEEVLRSLNLQMDREHELRSNIIGALMYPMVVVSAMLGIGALMLVMVVPKLAQTFKDLNVELPLTTQFVIGIGTFLAEKWYLAILIIIASIFFFKIISKTKQGRRTIDTLIIRIPIVSPLVKKTNSAYTMRTLSSLIKSGVPIVRS